MIDVRFMSCCFEDNPNKVARVNIRRVLFTRVFVGSDTRLGMSGYRALLITGPNHINIILADSLPLYCGGTDGLGTETSVFFFLDFGRTMRL